MKLRPFNGRQSIAIALAFFSYAVSAQTKDPGDKPGATGTVSFMYQGKKVTYTTVRAKDGNIWLQQNLGSKEVAQTVNDPKAYGDLFQWGRWDDGHQVREPLFSSRKEAKPNNPIGLHLDGSNPYLYDGVLDYWWIGGTSDDKWEAPTPNQATANNGCDPCRLMGLGWHMPTIDEWNKVIADEEITDGSSNMHSNLKLSYGGEREWNGITIMYAGSMGDYWSSTAANRGGSGKPIVIAADGINTKSAYYRGSGLSIRCIKTK